MARIASIVYQPTEPTVEDGFDTFARVPVDAVRLIAGHGIEGDAKAGRNPRRQLNLLSRRWLDARGAEGFRTEPGAFGEQLIVEGIEVETLQRGQRLRLGAEALIEITFPRTGCLRLDAAQPQRADLSGRHIGMLATVIEGGTIRVGDAIETLPLVADEGASERTSPATPPS